MSTQAGNSRPVAVVPLAGNQDTDEAYALGALFSKLLGDHLERADIPVVESRVLARYMALQKHELPPDENQRAAVQAQFRADALVYGWYVYDEDGKQFGVRLIVEGVDEEPPIEASTPVAAFPRFVEHVSLALIEALGIRISDDLRRRIKSMPRPAQFEAFRQAALAQAAWSRGQHELALAAAASALALDNGYEDALAVQVAVARAAGDSETARTAFQGWSAAAVRRGDLQAGAERLLLLGHWLRDRGEWADARRAYEGARNLFERDKDEVGSVQAQNNIANMDLMTGKTQAAIKTYRRSLRVFELHSGTQRDTATALLNLSLAHRTLGQRDEALIAAEQAATLARGLGDAGLEARAFMALGAVRHDMGLWSRADEDYARAGSLLEALDDEPALATVRCQQAILYKQQGNYQRAEDLLFEALSALKRELHVHEQAVTWLNLADLYYSMQLFEQAWEYADRADKVFRQLGSDCAEQSRALLAALERLSAQTEPEEEAALPDDTLGPEALYNGSDLAHNEYQEKNSGDDDAGVNSSVGRTPMM